MHLWHLASLDAPTVAVVWTFSFGWARHVAVPASIAVLTGLTVWAVYVGDRLLDVRRALGAGQMESLRERHFFHWRNRRWLVPAAMAAAAVAAWLFFARLPAGWFAPDAAIGAAAMGYFACVHGGGGFESDPSRPHVRGVSKELLVGVLFALGCAAPAWIAGSHSWSWCATIAFFAALAWLNCSAIDKWESADRNASVRSIALIFAATGACVALLFEHGEPRLGALLAAGATAALLLAILDRMRGRMNPTTVRALADLVMLAPLGLLLR